MSPLRFPANLFSPSILRFLLLLLAGSSCSKGVHPNSVARADYLPSSPGSYWKYSGDVKESKIFLDQVRTFEGKIYRAAETSFDGHTTLGYFSRENGNYYSRGFLGTAGDTLALLILKDNVPAGTTWYDTLAASLIPIAYQFTIDQKNIKSTVKHKTYENVIKVKMEVSFILQNTTKLIATEYLSFAPGVGIIQLQTISSKGKISLSTLDRYKIK